MKMNSLVRFTTLSPLFQKGGLPPFPPFQCFFEKSTIHTRDNTFSEKGGKGGKGGKVDYSKITTNSQKMQDLCVFYLYFYKLKENPRVSFGKNKWKYWSGQPVNLREILSDEVVIEFDMPKNMNSLIQFQKEISYPAVHLTGINLLKDNIDFEIWEHNGKSPHIHIHNLPISHLSNRDRKLWKQCFIRKYVPEEYHKFVDFSLCGIHLVALEYAKHWKRKYGIKRLLYHFKNDNLEIKRCALSPDT